jgi:hypothetical protein
MSGQISLIEKKMEKKWKFIFNSIFIIQNTNFQFQQLLIITIKGSYKKENDVCLHFDPIFMIYLMILDQLVFIISN